MIVKSMFLKLDKVAPLAGAWIEMAAKRQKMRPNGRRSPRGSVD